MLHLLPLLIFPLIVCSCFLVVFRGIRQCAVHTSLPCQLLTRTYIAVSRFGGKPASYLQQAVCVRRKIKIENKNTKKSTPRKTPHEIHSSPATTTTWRRRATKHAPLISPYFPASKDPGLVEIVSVQLSQPVKTTKVTHTLTDTQTDKLNNGTLYAPRYEEAFLPKGKERPHYEEFFLPHRQKTASL